MKRTREQGSAAVEFALLLPVLVLLIFGIIEFGVLLYDQQVITNASREGARYGIRDNGGIYYNYWQIQTVVDNYINTRLISFGFWPAWPIVTTPNGTCTAFGNPANGLQVSVAYQYTFLVLGNFGFRSPLLTARTTMTCE
jgi:Flp pilus assembly protein TadG